MTSEVPSPSGLRGVKQAHARLEPDLVHAEADDVNADGGQFAGQRPVSDSTAPQMLAATVHPGPGRRPAMPVVKVIEPPGCRCGAAACTAHSAPKYRRAKN